MDNVWESIIKSYGITGAFLVFAGWMLKSVLNHFMVSLTRKDQQVTEISEKISGAINANTKAIADFSNVHIKLNDSIENMSNGVKRIEEKHEDIVNYLRKRA